MAAFMALKYNKSWNLIVVVLALYFGDVDQGRLHIRRQGMKDFLSATVV